MPYLGNIPATNFSAMSYQDLTGGTGTSFTLDYAAGSAQDIEVYVNNVRQEPGVAYTVAGTALTMTGSIVATDDFYVVFQGKAQQTVSHPAGNALQATTGTFSGALSATTGTFSSNVDVGGSLFVDTIKEGTGTTTAMTIDSSGNVNIPGHVVQTVTQNFTTGVSTTSSSFVATGVSLSITPTSASNKILILGSVPMHAEGITGGGHATFTIFRGGVASGTNLGTATFGMGQVYSNSGDNIVMCSLNHIDSPATTSSVTYEIGILKQNPSITSAKIAVNGETYNLTLMEIAQ